MWHELIECPRCHSLASVIEGKAQLCDCELPTYAEADAAEAAEEARLKDWGQDGAAPGDLEVDLDGHAVPVGMTTAAGLLQPALPRRVLTVLETLRLKVAVAGPTEQCRDHGPEGGANCIDPGTGSCGHSSDWFCPGCDRWMCWCRGGDYGDEADDDVVLSRICDSCWYAALQEEQRRLLRLLRARAAREGLT
jgi:hypothetical protein